MKNLTQKQKDILDFIEEFLLTENMAPTVYEIAEHFQLKTSTVFAHLRALQRKNELTRSAKARSISLTRMRETARSVVRTWLIPLLGRVNAGLPSESLEFREAEIPVIPNPGYGDPKHLFALRIQGESMRDIGILDGDIVLVSQQLVPRSGDVVVALLQSGEATVKSFHPLLHGELELRPANPAFSTQRYQAGEVIIQGKVVALQREF